MNKNRTSLLKTQYIGRIRDWINKAKEGESLILKGLFGSSKAYAMAASIHEGLHLAIFPTKDEAIGFTNDLYNLIGEEKVWYLPGLNEKRKGGTDKELSAKVQRTSAIGLLSGYSKGEIKDGVSVIVTYEDSIAEDVPSVVDIDNSILKIKVGDTVPFDKVPDILYESGFVRREFVSIPGEFAVRGGIIDLFSFDTDKPYRIDFFGDEIESIKIFEPNTQRTISNTDNVTVYPDMTGTSQNKKIEMVPFFNLVPSDTVVWVSELKSLSGTEKYRRVFLSSLNLKIEGDCEEVTFNISPQPVFNKNYELLCDDIIRKREEGYTVTIMSDNESQIKRLTNILSSNNIVVDFCDYSIQSGFIDNDTGKCLYTDHQIFDRYRRMRLSRSVAVSERLTINDLNSFREGDYIVHIDHGIGRFGGLVKNKINGKVYEAIKIIYKDGDVLFVSVHGLHRISKYRSGDVSTPPKINKLGSSNWEKLKNKTKSKVKDIAGELVKLYSQRRVSKGFAFSADTYLQQELESSFKYEETPDQIKAVEAVKADMEKDYPMDRLVCGDVGFGKTEVAIRAAFKAVADSKQVAVLVPTTILALQHFKTFSRRLRNFPCNIEFISRLKSTKQINDITKRLADGKIDILIGTHRLLNKSVVFKDLGLLIIDEEQKFGVAAKESLRKLKLNVDTLTLTATPIPRTLQFSLLGARDLSIIGTPPPNRIPIQTEIIEFDEEIIRDIINEEMDRGGQIFFVHNRVHDIYEVEAIIKRIVPKARTCVAHGQMEPKVLENIIIDYMEGDYDILIATTIIENGIDIPNTNTIIINQAQNFGLSDLHQLRGRVGRSDRKAFCYLIVPPMISLTDDARRRLNAIEAFSDLGSGFNIAMQDLDIRGMGNMLGAEQSGYIAEMGIDTYQKILAEAFEEIKGELPEDFIPANGRRRGRDEYVSDCVIDTDMELLIPDSYINITAEKIRLYKELDSIDDEESIKRFIEELEDRFGPVPEQVNELIYVVRLRIAAKERGFDKIVLKNEKMVLYFVANALSPFYKSKRFEQIIQNVQSKDPDRYTLKDQNNRLYIVVKNVRTIKGAYNLISKL